MNKRKLTFVCGVVALAMLGGALVAHAQPAKPDRDGWISLLNGKNLSGWHIRRAGAPNSWTVVDGILTNAGHGVDLVTDDNFGDIELHVEFRIPSHSNSGVYLQGRYEVQVLDSYGQPPKKNGCASIYNKIAPTENACRPPGQWEVFDIKFIAARLGPDGKVTKKARMTVVHNGKLVIDNAEVDGPTGGQLDNNDGHPGPVMIQGNHGAIEVRSVKYRPLKPAPEGT